ncbi:MAG: hypothetical protein ACI8WT_002989 [Clostridium sp.]|jgi:hypothetical protein
MKFRTNMFLEVSDRRISGMEFSKNRILNRALNIAEGNAYYKDIENIKDFKIDIKNKNLYVLVEGETIYIKLVTLPLVKKYLINDMIKNELRYYYKDIDHIAFTYKLIKEDKTNMEILVFCLKGNNLDILENSIDNNINLKKVNLIQFCFKNYYASKIDEKNYILIFYYNCNLYFLICHNNEIVANNIINVNELLLSEFSYIMNEFLEKYNGYAKLCEKIYYSNIEGLNIDEFEYLTLSHQILEDLKREELLKYIIVKG